MQKRGLVVGPGSADTSAAVGLRQAGWTPVIVGRIRNAEKVVTSSA